MPDANMDFDLFPYVAAQYLPKGDSLATVRWRGHFVPPGVNKRAVPGHEFGLNLTAGERRQLIAFLRTL
jgi:hypothetical protein